MSETASGGSGAAGGNASGSGKVKGGAFVIEDLPFGRMATPEDFTEEQRMIARTTEEFVAAEIVPHDEEIEGLDYALTVDKLRKAGETGLLGADVPEAYGGLGLDKIGSTLITEKLTPASSFALSVGAHVGIGTLPIVYFGSEEQKRKYLPSLASGEKLAAYCLTEPTSGSDALGARTTATRTEDGRHYVLNGAKQFITNAGFADVFIVYAKVNGADFSTFIVERTMPGVSVGPEEKKMGIKGSSTCSLILEDVKVPAENLLWEVGKGHLIAFNILNIGRFKLAAGAVGACKDAIGLSAKYASEREQFGRPIASFPLIAKKLAEMNVRTFALESMVYRTAGLFDEGLTEVGSGSTPSDPAGQAEQDSNQAAQAPANATQAAANAAQAAANAAQAAANTVQATAHAGQQAAKAIAEYQLECSINKVFGSETLDFVVDEGVQIHGGYGYIREYRIERMYRDSRINRIFEGTNEINRLLIPGTLLKRALKGELPLMEKAMRLQAELLEPSAAGRAFEEELEQETHLLAMTKKIVLLVGAAAVQKYQAKLEREQEVLAVLADLMIAAFAMESVLLRARKLRAASGEAKARNAADMATAFVHDEFAKVEAKAKEALAAMETGDTLRTQLSALKKLARTTPADTVGLKRQIAARVVAAGKYVV